MTECPVTGVSIVLPAYNEEAVIADTVGGVLSYAASRALPLEVIVVNDGSRDRTREIVEELMTRYPEVRLVNHPTNRGYGEALRSGFDAARMDWIFLMDADGQFDITELDSFIPLAPAHDLVLGYRKVRADAWHRVLFGWGYTLVMNVLFRMRFEDIDCAFKLFRRSAWQAVQPIASTDHKVFTVEWLWRSVGKKLRIVEVPVRHFPRQKGTQTGARLDVIWQMVKNLIALRFR